MAELLILGSGTGLPHKKRSASSYLLSVEGKKILLDSGPGVLRRLHKCGLSYHDIDYILYSHLHLDHIHGLASILFAAGMPMDPRKRDLPIIGPKGLKSFYDKLLELYGSTVISNRYAPVLREVGSESIDLGVCSITTKHVEHTSESIGFRLELKNGSVLAYSGDTGYCGNVVSLARNADLLILECSFPDEFKVKGHLTPSSAGKVASEAGCKKAVLTHIYPICDKYPILEQFAKHFKGEAFLAEDYMSFNL